MKIETIIGNETERRITAHKFGDTIITDNGFLVGDPCYWMSPACYSELTKAASQQQPDAYCGKVRKWVSFWFRGRMAFFRSQSDGCGDFGCCVDSGWVVAIPAFAV